MSLAQLEYNLKVCALSHYIHSFLLTNPCETSMIYDALEYLFFFSENYFREIFNVFVERTDYDNVRPSLSNSSTR